MKTPINTRDLADPGDMVQRKFRYQHAYGVILAIAMVNKKRDYVSLWCEQHEDILAERNDKCFDAYQVKTRKSESGEWQLNNEQFVKSIARFVALEKRFPTQIKNFYFVSNANFSDSNEKRSVHLSPRKLIDIAKSHKSLKEVSVSVVEGFSVLKNLAKVDEASLRIPSVTDHQFRHKPITDSEGTRSPVPKHSDH